MFHIGMSLCAECFNNADHEGHDYNRFFSQAGGACDCGNADVLREAGCVFCGRLRSIFSICCISCIGEA